MYKLFDVCGLEIEYMVVDKNTRAVRNLVEPLLDALEPDSFIAGGNGTIQVEWSNELVAHVAEAKCALPVASPAAFLGPLCEGTAKVNTILATLGGRLMPSAAHPWMNPATDATLWPRDEEGIYKEYDRIFGCNTHGWTNLQSVHINLPFAGDEEFGRLHAAIRVVLPLIPALAAASPLLDAHFTGLLDARMEYYRTNSLRIPAMTGPLIPEPVFTEAAYRSEILERIYQETGPLDPKGILHDEWANARGAIARFDRSAIEIRVMDSQECPLADMAMVHAVIEVCRLLCAERFASLTDLKSWDIPRLYRLFFDAVKDADKATLAHAEYATLFGLPAKAISFGELWAHIFSLPELQTPLFQPVYNHYLKHGPLARRILNRYGKKPDHTRLIGMVDDMCACLQNNLLLL